MLKKIFIDIDGVLNRFHAYSLLLLGCPVNMRDDRYSFFDPSWGDDWMRCVEQHTGKTWPNYDAVWKALPEAAWGDPPLSSEGTWLVEFCRQLVGKDNVAFLSSPVSNPASVSGKLKWIEAHFPQMAGHWLIGECKTMCASSEVLLIDHRESVIREFQLAGGRAVTVPRPWNKCADLVERSEQHLRAALLEWVK